MLESVLAWLRYRRLSSFHTRLSKLAGVLLSIYVVTLFLWGHWQPLLVLAAAVSILASLEEMVLLALLPEWRSDVPGSGGCAGFCIAKKQGRRYSWSHSSRSNPRQQSVHRNLMHVAAVAALALVAAGCGNRGEQGGAMPPPEVAVAEVTRGNVPTLLEYTGRAVGSRDVEVRARVSGILLERRYEEGSDVRQGELLFRIDPEPYRAAAAQARAELGVAQARLDEARRQRDRILPLFAQNAASQRQRDEVVSQFEVAQANVAAAQARLRTAELDLSYTEVRAPIGGLTSREVRSEGSLVAAGTESSLLTRIVQTDPIYVEFSVPEAEAARVRKATAAGTRIARRAVAGGRRQRAAHRRQALVRRHLGRAGFRHGARAGGVPQRRPPAGAGAVPARAGRGRGGRRRDLGAAPRRDDQRAGQFRLGRRRRARWSSCGPCGWRENPATAR